MSNSLERALIPISDYRVFNGPDNGLMQITPSKHPKAIEVYNKMRNDNWHENEVDMSMDVATWGTLTDAEKRAYRMALAFLSNLDGMQLHNLEIVSQACTSPWYKMAMARQVYDESLHVMTYSLMIETMGFDAVETYNMFMTDDILFEKNRFVKNMNALVNGNDSLEGYILSTVANQALEGIMFQSGFLIFYVLSEGGKMHASAKQIKFIQRDELNHLRLFFYKYADLRTENPDAFTPALEARAKAVLKEAAEMEIRWGKHLIKDGIMGLSDEIVEGYVKHLADYFADGLGLGLIYGTDGITPNPCEWVNERMSEFGIDVNFFEDKPDDYDSGVDW
jgi:ribonucleoside-diphosphate reductase beta chain